MNNPTHIISQMHCNKATFFDLISSIQVHIPPIPSSPFVAKDSSKFTVPHNLLDSFLKLLLFFSNAETRLPSFRSSSSKCANLPVSGREMPVHLRKMPGLSQEELRAESLIVGEFR